ncbi:GDSL family lipase [Terrilactibacillus sp. BCM23-1]|uniref:GDSL family lipase n=1 Tax=Terrilactibacillus tamarindi TaxID=2599694 RepID=A0A6N8CR58_9BACI|nr:GDSL-type esterase/lipase family protein [Terrilactibacillus tamarindi]MTT32662.1 GDSL family lipase [Terrilactibacillus tamarindi]
MNKKIILIFTSISILSAFICFLGLFWAVFDKHDTIQSNKRVDHVNSEEKKNSSNTVHIVALGDSLTRGIGDDKGKGYVGDLKDMLIKKSKKKIQVTNHAIGGQTSSELLKQLKQPEVRRQLRQADIILISTGANDLFQGGAALDHLNMSYFNSIEKRYLVNAKHVYSTLRSLNSHATVFHIGLYNPFIDLEQSKLTSKMVSKWNVDNANLTRDYKKMIYVPTFDLFQLNVNDYLYSDKFHPNTKGYQLIAERVVSLIVFHEEGK